MNAAYKWRLDNGVYAYLVDETGINGPFIYYRSSNKRVYDSDVIVSGDTGLTVNEVYKITNDIVISSIVDDFNEAKYVSFFNKLYNMVMEEYPNTVLLDASYYYNIGINECSDSGSSELEYDILFNVANTETSDHSEVRINNINTNPYKGDLKYDMYFKLEKGEKGDVPVVNATASAKMIDDYKEPKVKVTKSGDVAEPTFNFNFEIPSSKGISSDGSFRPVDTYEGTEDKKSETVVDSNGVSNMEYYPSDIGKDVIHNETTQTSTGITSTEYNENGEKLHETIINSSSVTTEHIYTQELVDNLESKTINETGWYRVYEGDFCTTARLSISRGPNVSENYYLSFNFGAKDTDNVKPYSDSITLINGSFKEGNQTIDKVRIVNYQYHCIVEVHINEIDDYNNVYRINNVQGSGKVVNLEESNIKQIGKFANYITTLNLINGISTVNDVKCSSIINNEVKYGLTINESYSNRFYKIYEYRTSDSESINSSVKMSINLRGHNEGYTFLLDIMSEEKVKFTQLSGNYGDEQVLEGVNLMFSKDENGNVNGYDVILGFDSYYGGGDVIYLTLVEGKGTLVKSKTLRNISIDDEELARLKEFSFRSGFYSGTISTSDISCNNISVSNSILMDGKNIVNVINNSLPVGTVMMYSGDTTSFDLSSFDWKLCDGKSYFITGERAYLVVSTGSTDVTVYDDKLEVFNPINKGGLIRPTTPTRSTKKFKLSEGKIFTTPDINGRFVVGVGKIKDSNKNETHNFELGVKTGETSHKLTLNEMPKHNHVINDNAVEGIHMHAIYAGKKISNEGPTWGINLTSYEGVNYAKGSQGPGYTNKGGHDGRHIHKIDYIGGDGGHYNIPQCIALYYIIKVK